MSRQIEGLELQTIQPHLEYARIVAQLAECRKDTRGVVIFRQDQVLGFGNNGPIKPDRCQDQSCFAVCGLRAIHAERRALMSVVGQDLEGASMLHVKVSNGQIMASGDLSCEDCSGFLLRAHRRGIGLREFILPQENGLIAYTIPEMDRITRQNLGLDKSTND